MLGVAIVVWLVAHADVAALFGVFPRIGWGFAAIIAARGVTMVVDCAAWHCLLPRAERPSFAALLPLRWIGEAINTTLPVAQIGGEVMRARLLQQRVVAAGLNLPGRGAASVAVDFSSACSPRSCSRCSGLSSWPASGKAPAGGRRR